MEERRIVPVIPLSLIGITMTEIRKKKKGRKKKGGRKRRQVGEVSR